MRIRILSALLPSMAGALLLAAQAPAQQREPAPAPGFQSPVPPEEPPPAKPGSVIRPAGDNESRVARLVREIAVGVPVRSELDRSDRRAEDDTYYEEWTFRGRPGTRVSISLGSAAFDPFLVWGRRFEGQLAGIASDDDGGEGMDSRLTVWIRDGEEYVIRANTYEQGSGRYTLFVEEAPARRDPGAPRGEIGPGDTRRGELGDGDEVSIRGTYSETWRFRGRPGQRARITAESGDFDTRLTWARMVGGEAIPLVSDDDGGEGTNSELVAQFMEDGDYAVVVSAMSPGQTGAYTLRVEPASR